MYHHINRQITYFALVLFSPLIYHICFHFFPIQVLLILSKINALINSNITKAITYLFSTCYQLFTDAVITINFTSINWNNIKNLLFYFFLYVFFCQAFIIYGFSSTYYYLILYIMFNLASIYIKFILKDLSFKSIVFITAIIYLTILQSSLFFSSTTSILMTYMSELILNYACKTIIEDRNKESKYFNLIGVILGPIVKIFILQHHPYTDNLLTILALPIVILSLL